MPGIYYVLRELDVRPCRLLILVAGPFLWFMVLLVGDVAQGQLPLSAEEAEDVALMTRLQEQVMALPEDSREEDGLKILLEHVTEFKDEATRRRVHLSIAELLAKLGDTEQSLVHFEKAGVPKSRETDPSGFDALSRGRFIDMLVETGKTTDVIQRALDFREGADVSDDEYAELTYAACRELIMSGKVDEGMLLGIEAAEHRPCKRAYEYLETLAGDADIRGHKTACLETYRWLEKNSGAFGATERFLSNLAHVEEDSGSLPRAISVLEQLAKEHPTSRRIGEQLLRLSVLYSKAGDEEKSTAIAIRVRDGDFPDELRAMARRGLDIDADESKPVSVLQPASTQPTRRFILLVVNGVLVLLILTFILARRGSLAARNARGSTGLPLDRR